MDAARKAGKRASELQRARDAMRTLGIPVTGLDPFDALMEEIARTAGHVRWLEEKVTGLDEAALVWNQTLTDSSTGEDAKGNYDLTRHEAIVSVWMGLYQKERQHLVNVSKVAISAGIAERQVQLAQQQGVIIVQVLTATLGDPELGLTLEQQATSKAVVAHHLRVAPSSDA